MRKIVSDGHFFEDIFYEKKLFVIYYQISRRILCYGIKGSIPADILERLVHLINITFHNPYNIRNRKQE